MLAYTHTHTHHAQCYHIERESNQTLPTFQWNSPARLGNVKQTLPYLGNAAQARSRKSNGGTWRGTLIHALEKMLREREREDRSGGDRPFNLLNIALCGLASLPFLLVPKRSHPCFNCPCSMRVHVKKKETSQETSKETNRKRSMIKTS